MIQNARKERQARLKTAKLQATEEIDAFRDNQMAKLKEMQATNESAELTISLENESKKEIEGMRKSCVANQDKAVEVLMKVVKEVDIEVPLARKGLSGHQ